jgi:DNA-binding MarR family transcriptional regulator
MPRGGRAGGAGRPRERGPDDVRDALTQQLDLPRGTARERVEIGDRAHTLRGSEVRTLAAVGAFRVADVRDFAVNGRDRWHGDIEHLREAGLVELKPHVLDGERTALVTLTQEGQALLDSHRRSESGEPRQAFYAGLAKPRELTHDAQLYRAYVAAAQRLHSGGARVRRVALDYELKREYQRFLQDNNRTHGRRSGRPDRSPQEVRAWAAEHGLPIVRDRVQFPDVRIEYEHPDGCRDREDLELSTGHYNSRQMAAKRASGFTMHHSSAGRLKGAGARKGASPFDPHVAEGLLR